MEGGYEVSVRRSLSNLACFAADVRTLGTLLASATHGIEATSHRVAETPEMDPTDGHIRTRTEADARAMLGIKTAARSCLVQKEACTVGAGFDLAAGGYRATGGIAAHRVADDVARGDEHSLGRSSGSSSENL